MTGLSDPAERVHVIVNPAAGSGRAGQLWPGLETAVRGCFGGGMIVHRTEQPEDATRAARRVVEQGADLIICVGGDGTVQETVNGMFEQGRPLDPRCDLGILHCGTGGGLAQSLGLARDPRRQLERIRTGSCRVIDLGRMTFRDDNGQASERIFVNECQVGVGGEVVKQVGAGYKRLGPTIAFGFVSIRNALSYRPRFMTVRLDGQEIVEGEFIGVMVGNGNVCAGGMRLTPAARPDDGWLDVVFIRAMGFFSRLRHFPLIYTGRHVQTRPFIFRRVRCLRIESPDGVAAEADGEYFGGLPCDVNVIPAALRVRGASP